MMSIPAVLLRQTSFSWGITPASDWGKVSEPQHLLPALSTRGSMPQCKSGASKRGVFHHGVCLWWCGETKPWRHSCSRACARLKQNIKAPKPAPCSSTNISLAGGAAKPCGGVAACSPRAEHQKPKAFDVNLRVWLVQ